MEAFFAGVVVGALVAVVATALCVASGRVDEAMGHRE